MRTTIIAITTTTSISVRPVRFTAASPEISNLKGYHVTKEAIAVYTMREGDVLFHVFLVLS
jgi:hypothetical protein